MDWLQQLLNSSSMGGGSSLMDTAKGGQQQMGLLQMLGMAPDAQYDSPIGPQHGTGQPMDAQAIDPAQRAQQRASMLANLGGGLSRFGAGMSKASGPSRMPVDFGQALAGGNDAMQAGQTSDMDMRLKEAQIGALGQKGQPDLEKQAQAIMQKKKMGITLSPQEEAIAGTYDAFQNKMQTVTMPDGTVRQVPAQRPVFGQLTGQTPGAMGGAGQAPRPQVNPMQRLQQLRQMRPPGM